MKTHNIQLGDKEFDCSLLVNNLIKDIQDFALFAIMNQNNFETLEIYEQQDIQKEFEEKIIEEICDSIKEKFNAYIHLHFYSTKNIEQ